ncbi:hypothetical protein J5751_06350 [bacterium]|nr:hypothetical protein [bacterium]
MRNYGIKLADTEFLNLFDDDEILKPDYLEKSFKIYDKISSTKKELKDFVLVPKLMFRQT